MLRCTNSKLPCTSKLPSINRRRFMRPHLPPRRRMSELPLPPPLAHQLAPQRVLRPAHRLVLPRAPAMCRRQVCPDKSSRRAACRGKSPTFRSSNSNSNSSSKPSTSSRHRTCLSNSSSSRCTPPARPRRPSIPWTILHPRLPRRQPTLRASPRRTRSSPRTRPLPRRATRTRHRRCVRTFSSQPSFQPMPLAPVSTGVAHQCCWYLL
jgi:hypothetical protein